jgi:protein SCO1/2
VKRSSILIVGLAVASVASAQYYGPKSIIEPGSGQRAVRAPQSEIGVDQKLNDYIPMDLVFTNESGKRVVLRELFKGRPVILMPVFYQCAGICNLELTNMADALSKFKKDTVGSEFDVLTFSIKPTEGPEMAAARKLVILDLYNRRGAEESWHFLTGDLPTIKKLTDSVGFRYSYDDKTGAVQHPAAAIVLTPEGQISKYFLETEYPQQLLLDSIKEAARGRIGIKVEDESVWNCIQVDPVTGQRSLNIIKAVNLAAMFTLVLLAGSVVYMAVKYKSKALKPGEVAGKDGA